MKEGQTFYTVKVVTQIGADKSQYFHNVESLTDVVTDTNTSCLRICMGDRTVTYPLCNVERFETEKRTGRR